MRKKVLIARLVLSLLAVLQTGCTSVSLSIANGLAYLKGQKVYRDIPYLTDSPNPSRSSLTLDIYTPTEGAPANGYPTLVFFYGGGWSDGSKDLYRFVAEPFVTKGYAVVVPDYRKYPQVRYPEFMQDAAAAVTWVWRMRETYNFDTSKVTLMGHSAGAHMAALLATDGRFLTEASAANGSSEASYSSKESKAPQPSAVVGLSGPYNFVPVKQQYKEVFAPAGGDASSAMPATYVDGRQPPMLLLHGAADDTVRVKNLEDMVEAVGQAGGTIDTKVYPDVDHAGILTPFSVPLRSSVPVVSDILAFLETVEMLAPNSPPAERAAPESPAIPRNPARAGQVQAMISAE